MQFGVFIKWVICKRPRNSFGIIKGTTMIDKDYKQISTDAAKIIRGLLSSIQTRRGGHYSCINPEYIDFSKSREQSHVGNFLCDAYQWLFDNCGIYWEKYLDFLTPEQREKVEKTSEKKDSTNDR